MAVGATPKYGFQFPYGDDLLSNGDDVERDQVQQIEDVLWAVEQQNLALTNRVAALEAASGTATKFYLTALLHGAFTAVNGAWVHPSDTWTKYSDPLPINEHFPVVNTTVGSIEIPLTGVYEVEVMANLTLPVAGLQRIAVASYDDQGRGRAYYLRTEDVGTTAVGHVFGGTLMIPYTAGQLVLARVLATGANVTISRLTLRLQGPFAAQSRTAVP